VDYSFSKVLHRVHPEIYEPTATSAPNVVEASEDMARWFQQHPYLQTSNPDPVTVGGVKGVRFGVVGEDLPKDYRGVCGTDRGALVGFGTGPCCFTRRNTQGLVQLRRTPIPRRSGKRCQTPRPFGRARPLLPPPLTLGYQGACGSTSGLDRPLTLDDAPPVLSMVSVEKTAPRLMLTRAIWS